MNRIDLESRSDVDMDFLNKVFAQLESPILWIRDNSRIYNDGLEYEIHILSDNRYMVMDEGEEYSTRPSFYGAVYELLLAYTVSIEEEDNLKIWDRALRGYPTTSLKLETAEEILEFLNLVSGGRGGPHWMLRESECRYKWLVESKDSMFYMGISKSLDMNPLMHSDPYNHWDSETPSPEKAVAELLGWHESSNLNQAIIEQSRAYSM